MTSRLLIAAAALTAGLAGPASAELETTSVTFEEIMDRAAEGTRDRNARVEFKQGASFMGIPVRGSGVAHYRMPASNRTEFEMDTPIGKITSTLIAGPDATWQVTESRMGTKAVKYPTESGMAALNLDPFSAFAGLNGDTFRQFVTSRFDTRVLGVDRSADPPVYVVELTNRDEASAGPARRITVRVGVDDAFPRGMEIYGPEDDLVGNLEVTSLELGLPLSDSLFTYTPGPGVEVQDRTKPAGPAAGWEGRVAPDFALPSLAGVEVTLSAFRGSFVVIDFWATWCPPCRRAMPGLEALHRSLPSLKVLAVNTENQRTADAYVKREGFTFTTLVDRNQEVSRAYGVTGIPTTFIIDPGGVVAKRLVGYHSEAQLQEALRDAGMQIP